jgi:hypothetical protein
MNKKHKKMLKNNVDVLPMQLADEPSTSSGL